MGRLLWLPDQYREWGFEPIEIDGWRTRGRDDSPAYAPRVFVDHHTGDGLGWAPSLGICINGRPGVPGPLCNIHTPRNAKGKRQLHVVASGRSNNAGAGGWKGYSGNSRTFGNERENRGTSADPWDPWETEDAVLMAACFFEGMLKYEGIRLDPSYYAEHKDWAPTRKVDAHTIKGADMRVRLGQVWNGAPAPVPVPPIEEESMERYLTIGAEGHGTLYYAPVDMSFRIGVPTEKAFYELVAGKGYGGHFWMTKASLERITER